MARRLVFRFDVDTHRCLTRGTPALRGLASGLGVPLSFFVNMGRATSRRHVLAGAARRAGPAGATDSIDRLGPLRKLGAIDTARVILQNPLVGSAHEDELGRLRDAGHELGLHGGRNHRTWQDDAMGWSTVALCSEVRWGLAQLRAVVSAGPVGFASPAWVHPEELAGVAYDVGIAYIADEHGHNAAGITVRGRVPSIATNVLGEPGGVGFLEWHRARRHDDGTVLGDFRRRLEAIDDVAVVYDHPFWAGVADVAMVGLLLREAMVAGIEVVTLGSVVAEGNVTDLPAELSQSD